EDYILLCLRIDVALARQNVSPFLDSYFGPPELKARVASESPLPLPELAAHARALLDRLPGQQFEPHRSAYLEKQTIALETICRYCAGDPMSLAEAARGCLDVDPEVVPESTLLAALQLYDQALPGTGDVRQRFQAWQQRNELPVEKVPRVVDLMDRVLAEARRRTRAFVPLPEGEALDLQAVRDKSYGAANWYLGNYRSRLELNVARPVNLSGLIDQMCHEGYPGHHTEYALKEAHLYHEQGHAEMSVYVLAPQLVISEGIASLAFDVIFPPEEAAEWAVEHLYRPLGIPVDDVDLAGLYRAHSLVRGDELSSNVIQMQSQGYTDEQVVEYFLSVTPFPEARVRLWLQWLKGPLAQIYNLSYAQGRRLIEPLLQGEGGREAFRRILSQQVYPSMLAEWREAQEELE
ncbi:MAG TPA: hypothetical protein VER55_15260, partial [Ardenticatenaceae bacterium]|nr:hypothetical protein [Ardenticatenaceae bacterium]